MSSITSIVPPEICGVLSCCLNGVVTARCDHDKSSLVCDPPGSTDGREMALMLCASAASTKIAHTRKKSGYDFESVKRWSCRIPTGREGHVSRPCGSLVVAAGPVESSFKVMGTNSGYQSLQGVSPTANQKM